MSEAYARAATWTITIVVDHARAPRTDTYSSLSRRNMRLFESNSYYGGYVSNLQSFCAQLY